jgi:hypothetical protein
MRIISSKKLELENKIHDEIILRTIIFISEQDFFSGEEADKDVLSHETFKRFGFCFFGPNVYINYDKFNVGTLSKLSLIICRFEIEKVATFIWDNYLYCVDTEVADTISQIKIDDIASGFDELDFLP